MAVRLAAVLPIQPPDGIGRAYGPIVVDEVARMTNARVGVLLDVVSDDGAGELPIPRWATRALGTGWAMEALEGWRRLVWFAPTLA
jgi:hypothetical protein